jgi:proteasome lid subunit RPN8/RPN11
MPTGDTSIPISLLRDVADALLKRPGAKVCDPMTNRPIAGLSTEYCSTIYVAGDQNSLSWRVTEPIRGNHNSCKPFFAVKDEDYLASQVWVVGYIHNHPCGTPPSSDDLGTWPTDAFDPYVAMAEVRLVPGNPAPAAHKNTLIEMASALVAERQDGTRVFLRYFPTGEVQQWSHARGTWVTLGTCAPRSNNSRSRMPQCNNEPLQLLRE